MVHDHVHHVGDYNRAFALGVTLNLGFVVVEFFFGLLSDSLNLLADASQNLSDFLWDYCLPEELVILQNPCYKSYLWLVQGSCDGFFVELVDASCYHRSPGLGSLLVTLYTTISDKLDHHRSG